MGQPTYELVIVHNCQVGNSKIQLINDGLEFLVSFVWGYINSFMAEAVIKSMDWFLYDNGLRHERVKRFVWNSSEAYLEPSRNSSMEILFENSWRLLAVKYLSWRRPLSYRNQSIYLLRKSMDWFLYDNDLCHERVKYLCKKGPS